MSKRVKVLISVLVAILLLAGGTTAAVMAQEEEPAATPEVGAKGLLARVAEILDIPEEDLVNAFKQAQQEMKEEALIRSLDTAVENGLITQQEADEIKEWWEQKPEVIDRSLCQRARGFPALRHHLWARLRGWD